MKFIYRNHSKRFINVLIDCKADEAESIYRKTKDGETLPLCQYPLDVQTETYVADNFVFLIWPTTIVHRITSSSPLWDMSASQLLTERVEIIVILEGTVR